MATRFFSRMRFLRLCVRLKHWFQYAFGFFILLLLAVGFYHIGRWTFRACSYCYHAYVLDDVNDAFNYSADLNQDYRYYENGSHSYIRDRHTNKKVLKDIFWIACPLNTEDSLLCFAKDGYRGFFNENTGQVDIPANRYIKAWLFSEGLAAVVEKDSTLKFINPAGETVLDKQFKYAPLPEHRGYLFKNGLCPLRGRNQKWGLIDKNGVWRVAPGYDDLELADKNCWICRNNGRQGLLNDSLRLVLKPEYREVLVTDNGIEVLKEDYTRQLLDYNGDVLNGFMYTNIRDLYYKTKVIDPELEDCEYVLLPYKEYQTTYSWRGDKKVGLMGPDGLPVTPPLFHSIEAVNENLFRCIYDESGCRDDEGASILINRKGQIVEPNHH